MAFGSTDLENYISSQIKKYKGIIMPKKAGMLERMTRKKLPCERLHPNPADEFCFPDIGPSFRIIGEYEQKIRKAQQYDLDPFEEPVMVEKMSPDGYLILNGHHRWAAAMRCGVTRIPVKIVNLTQETDIRKVLQNSKHDKRLSVDLDEVVFASADESLLMKPLPFPRRLFYKERIRIGIPAIFHFLAMHGYDIWLYTSAYYSYDYLKHLMHIYGVHADGVITGAKRKTEDNAETKEKIAGLQKLFRENYTETLTFDGKGILRTFASGRDFEHYELDCAPSDWPHEVMNVLEQLVKDNKI
ncbi:MAG: ParB/RepB/Spo0J family partition protein [Lachnospiraceae bacterium]|nr:ParB/RepB/Spo0J family partition protein [Lachnospiraceae bacterium]